jgi:glycosyltransferase involved in cell wall biosynthesis
MGEFVSNEFKSCIEEYLKSSGLDECIDFLGVLEGENKWRVFAYTDILCFPTFFESESFGLVLIEAFSFEIPVVATNWRGIPSVVDDGIDGYLVPTNDPQAVANKLEVLIKDPALRRMMGVNGRKKYLNHYTIDLFQSRMGEVFTAVLEKKIEIHG